jgi:WD40 repeat protein
LLLAGSGDGLVRMWDLLTGDLVQSFHGHTDGVYHAIESQDGTRILSGGRDGRIRLWDLDTGRCLRVISGANVQCLAWHLDQRRFVSCADDIRIWDSDTGVCELVLSGHTDTVRSVAWSRDGRQILSASHDRSVRIWDVETRAALCVLDGHRECVVNAAWSRDEFEVCSCDSSGGLTVWAADG